MKMNLFDLKRIKVRLMPIELIGLGGKIIAEVIYFHGFWHLAHSKSKYFRKIDQTCPRNPREVGKKFTPL